jgi:hypothetical protein
MAVKLNGASWAALFNRPRTPFSLRWARLVGLHGDASGVTSLSLSGLVAESSGALVGSLGEFAESSVEELAASLGTRAGVGVPLGCGQSHAGAPSTLTLKLWLKTEPSEARRQQHPVCVPINTPGLALETTTATQPALVLKAAPPLGGVTSR